MKSVKEINEQHNQEAIRNINFRSWLTLNNPKQRVCKMKVRRSDNQTTTPLVLFIGPTKRLKYSSRLKKKLKLRKGILV
jgi:hypothetical protein